jgi:multiple sugar transport system permease protein
MATRRSRSRIRLRSVLTHGLLIVGAIAMLYPLLWMLSSSIKPPSLIFREPGLWPSAVTLDNYVRGWSALGVPFGRFFLNSLFIASLAVIGTVLSSSVTAYAFARLEFPLKRLWFALMLMTIMLPSHVTLIPQYIFFLKLGWVNTFYPLFVTEFFATSAFFVFLNIQFIRGIPRELDEVAEVDGASHFQIYTRIIFPLSTPALITTAVFTFIWNWDNFFSQLLYISDIRLHTVPLALRVYSDASGDSSFGPLFAMSCLSLVPVFLLFVLAQRFLVQGIATTGTKG